jgi:hypothetical protein
MTNHTTNQPIDPTGPLTIGQIPDADPDRMVAATAEPTWRDYAGKYAALLDEHEQRIQDQVGHIPTPAAAIGTPSVWLPWDEDTYARTFTCWEDRTAEFEVRVVGWQFHTDRPIEYEIVFTDNNRGDDLTADHARALGQILVAAADVIDRLANATSRQ